MSNKQRGPGTRLHVLMDQVGEEREHGEHTVIATDDSVLGWTTRFHLATLETRSTGIHEQQQTRLGATSSSHGTATT